MEKNCCKNFAKNAISGQKNDCQLNYTVEKFFKRLTFFYARAK